MARSHGPPNGSDHPPQNGHRAKQVAIALFIATTFGIMAILSFPLSGVVRAPLKLLRPLEAALSPAERALRPLIPALFGTRPRTGGPRAPVVLPRERPGAVAARQPTSAPVPGLPGGPPPGPPGPPPPGEGSPPGNPAIRTLTLPSRLTLRPRLAKLVRRLTTLANRSTRISRAEARRIGREISILRKACSNDGACKRELKRLGKLLHRLRGHGLGRHERERNEGTLGGRGHRPGGGHENGGNNEGRATRGDSRDRHRTHGKHGKHDKKHQKKHRKGRKAHRRHRG